MLVKSIFFFFFFPDFEECEKLAVGKGRGILIKIISPVLGSTIRPDKLS